jgi:CxxC motif-containing protein (DUF1111 family)
MNKGRGVPEWIAVKTKSINSAPMLFVLATLGLVIFQIGIVSSFGRNAQDPGLRKGADAGAPLRGLTADELEYFNASKIEFAAPEEVDEGLGPRMNLDSCGGCHIQPALGGSSPAVNPQVAFATQNGGRDFVPSFISANGPVREARFVRNPDGSPDGGVHALFTITGRVGANGCSLAQPDFAKQVANRNIIFRIPTPTFGAGLIEQISDAAILANQAANAAAKNNLGIRGRTNKVTGLTNNNGNDGTIARFGWKAQNKSLLLFSGEAYNVEMGITNELFQTEREERSTCQFADVPNDITDVAAATPIDVLNGMQKFPIFMRLLAAPTPSQKEPGGARSIRNGNDLFNAIGCALCHTPSFTTTRSKVGALKKQAVNLFSDLLIHDMGDGLADGVSQGEAGPREFRSAPLWGLGQRIFFLHDGRTSDLVTAIKEHQSSGSEANSVISNYFGLSEDQKQDLLNFLRSL